MITSMKKCSMLEVLIVQIKFFIFRYIQILPSLQTETLNLLEAINIIFFNRLNKSNMRVQTEAIHFSADIKLLTAIENKLQKLEHFFDKIIEAKVILKLENSGIVRDKIAEIRLNLPNGVIFIKETSKTFEAALDKAIVALKRQLVKYKEKTGSHRVKEILD